MRGDSEEYNAILIEQNCKEAATSGEGVVDMELALKYSSRLASQQFAHAGSGFGRFGGPKAGTPPHKSRMPPEEAIETSLGK